MQINHISSNIKQAIMRLGKGFSLSAINVGLRSVVRSFFIDLLFTTGTCNFLWLLNYRRGSLNQNMRASLTFTLMCWTTK